MVPQIDPYTDKAVVTMRRPPRTKRIGFDIETAVIPGVQIPMPEPKLGNLKDPAKIESKRQEVRDAAISHAALDPRFAFVLAIGAARFNDTANRVITKVHAVDPIRPNSTGAGTRLANPDELVADEAELIGRLASTLGTSWYVTFNGHEFDVPFLRYRAMMHGIVLPFSRPTRPWETADASTAVHLDVRQALMTMIPGHVTAASGIPVTLEGCSIAMLNESCPYGEDDIDKSQMLQELINRRDKILEMCAWDVQATLAMADILEFGPRTSLGGDLR